MAKTTKTVRKTIEKCPNKASGHQSQKLGRTHSWTSVRGILSCRNQNPKQQVVELKPIEEPVVSGGPANASKKCKKMRCSGSLCSNTKVMHRPLETSPSAPSSSSTPTGNGAAHKKRSLSSVVSSSNFTAPASFNSSATTGAGAGAGSFRGGNRMNLRRFSGCYECRMVVDPLVTRDPSLRSTICSCPECSEIFMKPESLELHQAVKHAVSELSPEDTSKNIVEIIFQSSWLKKQTPICKIDHILKVRNTQKTISKFEEYRDQIKSKASKFAKKQSQFPRCVADGNELLRFHCTTFSCPLGLDGSTSLCCNNMSAASRCNVCSIIKNGFKVAGAGGADVKGILTTATSGRAHDRASGWAAGDAGRAMLVCRVIAGRVKKSNNCAGEVGNNLLEEYDSVGGAVGVYSNLDELYVFNPRAILPCFVVIYRWF
ncbi:uncharacterized protein LOC116187015 [Punica granatum]|uniref:Uncharacterized protein LOC116187015 n=1 Tax=Punica granatum TaxID=22663 RepID=A0A6P8BMA0_PUNGR|nr:uncharacterized protein LOC116187015 [Punica granatum]